jgi:hypothetical protein
MNNVLIIEPLNYLVLVPNSIGKPSFHKISEEPNDIFGINHPLHLEKNHH